jgi:hypothetical protein
MKTVKGNMEKPDGGQTASQSFDLAEIQRIAKLLWGGRIVIVSMTVLTTLLSILYLHTASYTYTATMALIPTQSQQRDIAGQFGGLAAMAGINLPGGINPVSPFSVYPETAQTRQVAGDIIRAWPEVMPALFKDQWDAETRSWHSPRSTRYAIFGFLRPILGIPSYNWRPPGAADLQQYIIQGVAISQDKKKSMLTIVLNASDPDFAKKFILTLHQSTNNELRRMTLDRAKKYSAYLANQLTTPQPSAVRDVLTQSLSDQETLVMMGSSDTDFAAQPLGLPESSPRPTKPVPLFVLLGGFLLGALVGGMLVVFGIPVIESNSHLNKAGLGYKLVKLGKR